jgi:hypothetical protein
MYKLNIKNGDLNIITSGLILIQDIKKPLYFNLTKKNKTLVNVEIRFELVDDISKAKAVTLDTKEDTTGILFKVPKSNSIRSIVDAPLLTVNENENIFLGMGWNVDKVGAIRFDYTFSVSNNIKLSTEIEKKQNG